MHYMHVNTDHDCVSSYQVNVYPDREECGGIAEREQPGIKFLNIDRVSTHFDCIICWTEFH